MLGASVLGMWWWMRCGRSSGRSHNRLGCGSCCRAARCKWWPSLSASATWKVFARCGNRGPRAGERGWCSPMVYACRRRYSKTRLTSTVVTSTVVASRATKTLGETPGPHDPLLCPLPPLAEIPLALVPPPLVPQTSQKVGLTLNQKRYRLAQEQNELARGKNTPEKKALPSTTTRLGHH